MDGSVDRTIFAPASGSQHAAIGVFRVSGPGAFALCGRLLQGRRPLARQFGLMRLLDPADGRTVDEVGVLTFAAPASYTGEDVLEIHHHGAPAIGRWLCRELAGWPGFRIAEAGEFTRRALRHGKLAAVQAEAVAAMVAAPGTAQLKRAARGLRGDGVDEIAGWLDQVRGALAQIEAEIDFGGEDDQIGSWLEPVCGYMAALGERMADLAGRSRRALELAEGATAVIFGAPNVGKSSLLNALVRREAAIVTAEAGTTRDPVVASCDCGGRLVRLVDTAGLREAIGLVERLGVEKTRQWLGRADLRIWVAEHPDEFATEPQFAGIRVLSKVDLETAPAGSGEKAIRTSARTGEGLGTLLAAIAAQLPVEEIEPDSGIVVSERQAAALAEAGSALARASAQPRERLDLLAEELRLATTALGRLLGRVDSEEVLDEIFSRFCIGK